VPTKIITAILMTLGIAICSLLFAVVIVIVTFVKRRRAMRRAIVSQPSTVPS
jgi:ABC-type arginine transport system permease subunit